MAVRTAWLSQMVADAPTSPGVYLFYGEDDLLLYVGQSQNLRRRLKSYVSPRPGKVGRKQRVIVRAAKRVEWEVCPSPVEACLKEAELIQTRHPKLNIAMAFSHTYPYIGFCLEGSLMRWTWGGRIQPPGPVWNEWNWFGAFRSRTQVHEGMLGLMQLLEHLFGAPHRFHHSFPLGVRRETEGTFSRRLPIYEFHQIQHSSLAGMGFQDLEVWKALLSGQDDGVLQALVMALVEDSSLCSRSTDIQSALDAVKELYDEEMIPLRQLQESGVAHRGFVLQTQRDPLFIRKRHLG